MIAEPIWNLYWFQCSTDGVDVSKLPDTIAPIASKVAGLVVAKEAGLFLYKSEQSNYVQQGVSTEGESVQR